MIKDMTFIGQPIFLQVIKLLSRSEIRSIDRSSSTNHYTKKFDGYNHLITLFKQILKGAGRNPKRGKKKGGMKVHTLIASDENTPQLAIMSSAATHDHIMLKELKLPEGSFVVFDRAYVDYEVYESFSQQQITYVTKLKKNARHRQIEEFELPADVDDAILIDEVVEFRFGEKHGSNHRARRIACWDEKNRCVIEYLSNNFELSPEELVGIYRRRWQIEVLFKQMKQNFQLKYFLGDNVNAIECQVWVAMIANLLISVIKRGVRRVCSYTGIVSLVRLQLMSYISLYDLLEKPEKAWLELLEKQRGKQQNTLFPT